jgi:hypothetical protein
MAMKNVNIERSRIVIILASMVVLTMALGAFAEEPAAIKIITGKDGVMALQTDITSYVAKYVELSDSVANAVDQRDTARDAYERAVAEKKAALTLEELKNTYETSEKSVLEAKNNAVISGLNSFLVLQRAYRDFEDKKISSVGAQEKLRVLKLRLAAGLINDDTVLQQENSLITAHEAERKSEEALKNAKADFCLGIGVEYCDSITLTDNLEDAAPKVGEVDSNKVLEAAKSASSSYYSAFKAEALAKVKYDAMTDPLIATKSEKEAAEKAWDSSKSKLETAVRTLQTTVSDAISQLTALNKSYEMQVISSKLAETTIANSEIKFKYGELLQYEIDAERNSYKQSGLKLKKALEDVQLQYLRIESLMGKDLLQLMAK